MRLLLISLMILILHACSGEPERPIVRNKILMNTYFSITVYDDTQPDAKIEQGIQAAFKRVAEIESQINPYDPLSLVGALNNDAGRERTVELPADAAAITRTAIEVAQQTGGQFEFTLWPVYQLWHFDTDSAAVPTEQALAAALKRVDYTAVQLDSLTLTLPAGVELDLNGISKGYAVEAARQVLTGAGIGDFIIDAGGNLGIEWQRLDPVEVKIRHPREDGQLWGSFPINRSCGIATSGDYHIYFEVDGKRYHHILDPATGLPANRAVSATVITLDAAMADGLSTALCVMGVDAAEQFIASQQMVAGMIIYQNAEGELEPYYSPGLGAQFTRF